MPPTLRLGGQASTNFHRHKGMKVTSPRARRYQGIEVPERVGCFRANVTQSLPEWARPSVCDAVAVDISSELVDAAESAPAFFDRCNVESHTQERTIMHSKLVPYTQQKTTERRLSAHFFDRITASDGSASAHQYGGHHRTTPWTFFTELKVCRVWVSVRHFVSLI